MDHEERMDRLLELLVGLHRNIKELLSAINSGMIGSADGEKVQYDARIAVLEFELFVLKTPNEIDKEKKEKDCSRESTSSPSPESCTDSN